MNKCIRILLIEFRKCMPMVRDNRKREKKSTYVPTPAAYNFTDTLSRKEGMN